MKEGKYESTETRGHSRQRRRRTFGNKSVALVLSLVLLVGGVIGGTVAWLTAKTDEVKNVFTTSDIGVTLEETTNTYKMIPGWTIAKDPKATVTTGSEDCYLFVKVEETGGNVTVDGETYEFDDFIAYAIKTGEDGWTKLIGVSDVDNVYYKVIDDEDEKNQPYNILGAGAHTVASGKYTWNDNEVLTKPEVTKEMMAAVNADTTKQPKLTFTAYAVQLYKNNTTKFTPAEAWELAQSLDTAG